MLRENLLKHIFNPFHLLLEIIAYLLADYGISMEITREKDSVTSDQEETRFVKNTQS